MTNARRFFAPTAPQSFRVAPPQNNASNTIATLIGYAIVWNTLSGDRGGYVVRLLPNSALFATPTLALFNHNFDDALGRTDRGTLRLTSDTHGVRVEIDLPATSRGRDLVVLVGRGDVQGMSFSMLDGCNQTTRIENGQTIFEVSEFVLDEVTVTPVPAFVDTSIRVARAADDARTPAPAYATRASAGRLQLERMKLNARRLLPL